MRIYLAGGSGALKRELIWMSMNPRRLLSFYEIEYDLNDQHFHKGAFKLIKEKNEK